MTINPLFKQLYNQEQVENKFWSLAELERSLQRDDTSIIILSCDNEIEGFLVYQNAFGEAELFLSTYSNPTEDMVNRKFNE